MRSMAINAPPETTPRMPPPSTTSPSFVLSPRSSLPSLRRPRRRLISSTTGWSGPGCVLEVPGVVEEAILLEALAALAQDRTYGLDLFEGRGVTEIDDHQR